MDGKAEISLEILNKRQLNRVLPIFCLPNELLSEVFLVYKDGILHDHWQKETPKYPTRQFAFTGLVYLLHICHDWRFAAITLPHLWTLIHVGPYHLEWAAEMIKLSSPFLITIYAAISPVDGLDEQILIEALLNNEDTIARLRELRIRNAPARYLQHLFGDKHPYPVLENLRIACLSSLSNEPSFALNDSVMVAPKLRKTSVVRCALDFKSHLLSNLTHIRLFHPPQGCRPTFSDFLAAISGVTALESLTVHCLFTDEPEDDLITTITRYGKTNIELPALESLQLNLGIFFMSTFLRCVKVPRTTIIRLIVTWNERDDSGHMDFDLAYHLFFQICWALALHFKLADDPSQPHIRSVRASESLGQSLHVQFFYEVLPHDELNQRGLQPVLDFTARWDGTIPAAFRDRLACSGMMALMLCFRGRGAFHGLVVLELCNIFDLGTRAWTELFSRLDSLRSIVIDGPSEAFWPALAISETTSLAFKALTNLVVQQYDMCMEDVGEILALRKQAGMPLDTLSVPEAFKDDCKGVDMAGCMVVYSEHQYHIGAVMKWVAVMDSEDEEDVRRSD